MRKVLAFDLGGTKFAFGVVNQDGTVLGSGRVETFAEKGPSTSPAAASTAPRISPAGPVSRSPTS
jgi:predicted NBD/HSP70 family sugar kinase